MNHGYEINSTPKHIPDMSYFEALMDFSTPMSTLSTRWNVNPTMKNPHESQMNISAKHDNNSSELNETMINVHDDHEKVADELLEKFRQHENHFRSTQTSLHRLDQHLCELGSVLRRLQASLDQNSSLRTTTDQLETRLIQMSTKRDQVRCAINHWSHSPVISQTLNDIIQRVRSLIFLYMSMFTFEFRTDFAQFIEADHDRSFSGLSGTDQGSAIQSE